MNKGRNCKKVAAALMALTMTAGLVPANICSFISVTANAEEVELIVPADEVVTDDETTAEEVVAVDYSALTEGEYVIDGDVTVESVITVSGVVNLTLNEGATLTAVQGIVIEEGAVLNVYGEGTLVATGAPNEGTNQFGHNAINGTINVYGGTINATASDSAQGYGATYWLHGNWGIPGVAAIEGDITVYGGKIIAQGGNGGDGGDGWYAGSGATGGYALAGKITIYGGDFDLKGGKGGKGVKSSNSWGGYPDGVDGKDGAAFDPSSSVYVDGKGAIIEKINYVTWNWMLLEDGTYTAVPKLYNADGEEKDISEKEVNITTAYSKGLTIYTATVFVDGKAYSNSIQTEAKVKFNPEVTYEKGYKKVTLKWDSVYGAQKYGVAGYVNGTWRLLEQGHGNSYVLKDLKPGTEYKVAVVAMFNGKWNADTSNAITVSPKDAEYPEVTDIEYSRQFHQFKLYWDELDDADEYAVAVKLAGKWKVLSRTEDTSYTSPKLIVDSTYEMVVVAKMDGKWDLDNIDSRSFNITVQ
ncbi:fibronectin type III domain-containing protein [Ruminococcus albus]|uniref:Fibronectin type-III domain-containing protein n=1 Tax=Ruminococcus albus TaxID=1264 RepID=A0A1I1Q1N9_RUMAL|nr:fibronectin type III domain-containing protein [Ruminococcus albus]SFD13143.1 hypothetical protein SAMN02910406_03183 [Ruminococcus albus]